ncbi:MAG: hypothetical protein E4H19_05640 [Chromatiales bacterium]|jgi:hypothetical protein|nr:MAG: hypothetical protein E4H19_05640 [Chromatiales bacterium]
MSARLLTPGMLMDVSESRLDVLRYCGTDDERRVVTRLLDQPSAYRGWGAFHYPLMQKIAATRNRREQRVRLRQTNFVLLHRQALFEYLRGTGTTGRDREALFKMFYGPTNYTRAVIGEHRRYLQSNSSLFCADHLETALMHDACFTSGFADYREQYMEYFSLYCDCVLAESRGSDYSMQSILLEMKQRLSKTAGQLIALPEYLPERRSASRRSATRWRPTSAAAG